MSHVENKFPFLITDGCDEEGNASHTIRVNEDQLNVLLEMNCIYEDTVSDYVKGSSRRHFHPMHENVTIGELADIVNFWPGCGGVHRLVHIYERAGLITINVPSNHYL